MLRGVTICILVALAGAALYITKSTWAGGPGEYTLKFPDRDPKYVNPVAPSEEYACDPITEAVAYENRLDGPTANARAGAGTEHVAIRMSPDGKGIFMLLASAVRAGATDAGDPIPITSASKAYIVASRANGLDVHTLILDVRTLKAVWTYTGQGMLGIKGFAAVLACH